VKSSEHGSVKSDFVSTLFCTDRKEVSGAFAVFFVELSLYKMV